MHIVTGILYLAVYVAHLVVSRLSARRLAARHELEEAVEIRQMHLRAATDAGGSRSAGRSD